MEIWRAEGKDRNVKIKIQSQKEVFNCKVLRKIIFSSSSCFEKTYLDFSHIQGKKHWLIKFDSSRKIYVKDLSYALSVKINLYYF